MSAIRRSIVLALSGAVVAAACTASSGVSREASSPLTSPTLPYEATGDGGSRARVEPPDASGLPSLDDVDSDIVTGTLDNGLRYMIRENDNPGRRVDMRLVIDAGSGLQDDDQGGGAHFLEHMLFNGTEQFPENELVAVLRSFGAAFGADINASTGYDETVYALTMPTADPAVVSTGLDVLQQWLSAATIDQRQVEAERGVVLDEWRGSVQTADGRVFDEIQRFFLDGTPYENRTPIGTDTEIANTDAAPLRAFYDDWYRPDNAAVIVVGDIDDNDIEQQIIDRFASAEARGASPERVDLVVTPATEPRARVVDDRDLTEGFAFVTLPRALVRTESPEAMLQREILDGLAFDIIGTRLANDARRGVAPFDDARVDSSSFVRLLDAPEIYVTADGADLEASTQAVLDEYERVRRYGFSQAEVDRAVAARRAEADAAFDGRFSRQDAAFADEYVRHVLAAEPVPDADRWYDYVSAVLDRATPATIAFVFVERTDAAAPHIFVGVPSDERAEAPDVDALLAQAAMVGSRELSPRPDDTAVPTSLMTAPEPVDEVSNESLADGSLIAFIAPDVLTFDNGVRVALNVTPIVEGVVLIEGRSPGGTAVLADGDVADAVAASVVVERSGVADVDRVELDAFLADKDVDVDATIDVLTEGLRVVAATDDLETAFQLIHLGATRPRVDAVALAQFVDDERPLAEDPSIDQGYAEFKTLTEARYDDRRYRLLDVDDLDSITVDDIARVYADRFGDASDWSFSLSGDFELDDARDLARTYLGTLPATGRVDPTDWTVPPPPPGVVEATVRAGRGDAARVSFLFSGSASVARRDDVAGRIVQEIVTVRLSDTIREELGESYSPFGVVTLGGGATPIAELYVSISTGPELVDSVSATLLAELADLRENGPTPVELSSARETVGNQLALFSNEQINDEVLRRLTDPAGHASFDDFLRQSELVTTITADDVRAFVERWAPADRYIEVRVLPR